MKSLNAISDIQCFFFKDNNVIKNSLRSTQDPLIKFCLSMSLASSSLSSSSSTSDKMSWDSESNDLLTKSFKSLFSNSISSFVKFSFSVKVELISLFELNTVFSSWKLISKLVEWLIFSFDFLLLYFFALRIRVILLELNSFTKIW